MDHIKELKKMLGALGSLEDLAKMFEMVEEEEVLVGSVSPALIARFTQLKQDLEDAKTQLERESQDMHKILERKKEKLKDDFKQVHNEVWADCYAELGIAKDEDRHYRFKTKKGVVVEVIEKTLEDDENVIDFQKKFH